MIDYEETEPCDCGHSECDGFKFWTEDPFAAEIYNDYSLYFMCGGEHWERKMDI